MKLIYLADSDKKEIFEALKKRNSPEEKKNAEAKLKKFLEKYQNNIKKNKNFLNEISDEKGNRLLNILITNNGKPEVYSKNTKCLLDLLIENNAYPEKSETELISQIAMIILKNIKIDEARPDEAVGEDLKNINIILKQTNSAKKSIKTDAEYMKADEKSLKKIEKYFQNLKKILMKENKKHSKILKNVIKKSLKKENRNVKKLVNFFLKNLEKHHKSQESETKDEVTIYDKLFKNISDLYKKRPNSEKQSLFALIDNEESEIFKKLKAHIENENKYQRNNLPNTSTAQKLHRANNEKKFRDEPEKEIIDKNKKLETILDSSKEIRRLLEAAFKPQKSSKAKVIQNVLDNVRKKNYQAQQSKIKR